MKNGNVISNIFNIKYPIIQGGMVWCSGWKLATAVSNNGGLGLIGAGSMDVELLRYHIQQAKKNTQNTFGVNIPLLKRDIAEFIDLVIQENIEVVFTSAGNPATWTSKLKDNGIKVAHVVANTKFAEKATLAGVDVIVAEGFEAGGHNGREETTTLTLIPLIKNATNLPIIAAGGIGNGRAILAAMALGAQGVQIGSLFATSKESSASERFKSKVFEIKEGDTRLLLKKQVPVRLIMNQFATELNQKEYSGASAEELSDFLGRGRAKRGIFDGDLDNGELEIGQGSALIKQQKPVKEIMEDLIAGYNLTHKEICNHSNYTF